MKASAKPLITYCDGIVTGAGQRGAPGNIGGSTHSMVWGMGED